MNKYDAIFNEIQRRLDNGEITLEKAESLNDMAYELYADELYSEAFEGDMSINKLLKDCRTEYQDNIKDIKKAIKDGNISVAKRNIQSAKKNIMKAIKIVDKIPTDASDDLLGYLVETGNKFIKLTLEDVFITAIVVGTVATVAGISRLNQYKASGGQISKSDERKFKAMLPTAGVAAGAVGGFQNSIKNNKNKLLYAAIGVALATRGRYRKDKDVNYYKAHAKKQFNLCMKHLDKLDKKLDKKVFKESCEYDESSSDDLFIDQVFDCYLEDVITDDEFLSIMESYNEDI